MKYEKCGGAKLDTANSIFVRTSEYGDMQVFSVDNIDVDDVRVKNALSKRNIYWTFRIINSIKSKIDKLSDVSTNVLVNITNDCVPILSKYIENSIINKPKKYIGGKHTNISIKDIIHTMIYYMVCGYNIYNIYKYKDVIGNNEGTYKLDIMDILTVVVALSIVEPKYKINGTENYKKAMAMLDEYHVNKYRNLQNTLDVEIYLIYNNIDIELYNRLIKREESTDYQSKIQVIEKEAIAIDIELLKKQNENIFKTYIAVNPAIKCGNDTVIIDSCMAYRLNIIEYVKEICDIINKRGTLLKLHEKLGHIQESKLVDLLEYIFEEQIDIKKKDEKQKLENERGKTSKSYDFDIKVKNKILHIESKFKINGLTTHYKKDDADKKAIKQLEVNTDSNSIDIVLSTDIIRLFNADNNNKTVLNMTLLGLIGYIYLLISDGDSNELDTIAKRTQLNTLGLKILIYRLRIMNDI